MWKKTAIIIAFFTGLSRILGLFREMLLSRIFGVSFIAEAFIVAFKFPNFFRKFFAEGAFNAAFIPYLSKASKDEVKKISSEVFSLMFFFMLGFVLFVEIFTDLVVDLIIPGCMDERRDLAVFFTRITFPYIAFVSMSAVLSGILNTMDKFKAVAAAPLILNICMIGALLYGYSSYDTTSSMHFKATLLAISVFVSGVIQLAWLSLQCYRNDLLPKLSLNLTHVKIILKKMIPGMLGAGVTQINIFIDMALASFLEARSIAYLYYADRLIQLPLSLIGISISTIMLSKLSKLYKDQDFKNAKVLQKESILLGFSLSLMSSIGIVILARPIISIIYEHGNFHSTDNCASALIFFGIGLPAHILNKILSVSFFAIGDTKTPVKFGLVSVLCNLFLNITLMQFLSFNGLALSTSISAWVLTGLLSSSQKLNIKKEIFKITLSSTFIGIILFLIQDLATSNLYKVAITTSAGIVMYVLMFFRIFK